MKFLTKDTDYALRTMMCLAKTKNRLVSSREISTVLHIPLSFLRKILRRLVQNKILTAREGIKGGVRLNVNMRKINVADVIKMFQGEVKLIDCMFRKEECLYRPSCALRKEMKRIEDKVIRELENVAIAKLLRHS